MTVLSHMQNASKLAKQYRTGILLIKYFLQAFLPLTRNLEDSFHQSSFYISVLMPWFLQASKMISNSEIGP